jgi:hypothetical protein
LALKTLPYKNLKSLIGRHLSKKEDPVTEEFVRELSSARRRGFLEKEELEEICKWKSSRAIWLIRKNTPQEIMTTTRKAFSTKNERLKIELLTGLKGVSLPMASAILTFINPKRYGVIDIRVWQLLYKMKYVEKKASGVGFNFENWFQFHKIIRHYAKMYNVKARDVERTLFNVHVLYQRDNLYEK